VWAVVAGRCCCVDEQVYRGVSRRFGLLAACTHVQDKQHRNGNRQRVQEKLEAAIVGVC